MGKEKNVLHPKTASSFKMFMQWMQDPIHATPISTVEFTFIMPNIPGYIRFPHPWQFDSFDTVD